MMDAAVQLPEHTYLAAGARIAAAELPDGARTWMRRPESEGALLTADEEALLAHRIGGGDQRAREEMIYRNLRLVTHIARGYEGYARGVLSFEDLVQEGRMGLIKAVDRYDPRRGCRFSTYASHWISQAISRAVEDQFRTIRVPAYAGQLVRRASRRIEELSHELGREPTEEELASDLGVTIERIAEIAAIARPTVSLDAPLHQDGEETAALGDFVEDNGAHSTFEAAHGALLRQEIGRAMLQLSSRERQIISQRFGLDDGNEQTLSEVGGQMHMTRERVRQIEKRALKKLRVALGPSVDGG